MEAYGLSTLGNHSMIIAGEEGVVISWGFNYNGQLGRGNTSYVPQQIENLCNVKSISCGNYHSVALTHDGKVFSWGNNQYGQLGIKAETDVLTPKLVGDLPVFATYISCGYFYSMAISDKGVIYSWGYNGNGELGCGNMNRRDTVKTPLPITSIKNIKLISCGAHHSLALSKFGKLYSWGANEHSQLGIMGDQSQTPRKVKLENIIGIACGGYHSMVLSHDGTLFSWGRNDSGQLGNGNLTDSSTQQHITDLRDVISISCGMYHSMALTRDGNLFSWGYNVHSQLANGSKFVRSPTPRQITGLTNVKSILCGGHHSMVLTQDGTLFSWGNNESGQLGNGTNIHSSTPQPINLPFKDLRWNSPEITYILWDFQRIIWLAKSLLN